MTLSRQVRPENRGQGGGDAQLVVLVDESGRTVGTAAKAGVHHRRTPLHLGFSCYVFDADGQVLSTRRADTKTTWPGTWTNSVCGHPAPGESLEAAVRRRARDELGLRLADVRLLLPAFRYTAVMHNGTRENELCPVLAATTTGQPDPDPGEVSAYRWLSWDTLQTVAIERGSHFSPWCVEQVRRLAAGGMDPRQEPEPDTDRLPPAIRLRT